MTTIQEDISQCRKLEHEYADVLRMMQNTKGMSELIQDAQRKLAVIKMKRLELESKWVEYEK